MFLKILSRSTIDLGLVLQTLVESAPGLCQPDKAKNTRQKKGDFTGRYIGFSQNSRTAHKAFLLPPEQDPFGKGLCWKGKVIHIDDVEADPAYSLVLLCHGQGRTALGFRVFAKHPDTVVISLTRRRGLRRSRTRRLASVRHFADQGGT